MKTHYVVGFAFYRESPEKQWKVVLIRKLRPDWQRDCLNGVGGHVEPGETPMGAMIREYREETGDSVVAWDKFLQLDYPEHNAVVHFFRSFEAMSHARTTTDEHIECWYVDNLSAGNSVPNLAWIIPLALSKTERLNSSVVECFQDWVNTSVEHFVADRMK